jgi:Putative peptidoglycan binding domain
MSVRPLLPMPLVLLALAPAAQAQTPTTSTTPVTSESGPAAGKATLSVRGGLATRKTRYYAPSQEVVVRGRVKPYVRGQVLTLYAIRRGKASKEVRREVRRRGRYEFRFKVGNPGSVRLVVKHRASNRQVAFRTRSETIQVVSWQAGQGARGTKVTLLQRGLVKLGFATPVTGYFDSLTANAVNAFRKTNGMGRDGYAATSVYALVLRRQGAFKLRYPDSGTHGKHVEFD